MVAWTEKEREAWRGREKPPIGIWARANLRLTTAMGAPPGPYDPDLTPWVWDIFEAFEDPGVERIVFRKPAQIGGTLLEQVIVAWIIDCDPANILIFMDTDTNAKYASDHRIQPLIDGSRVRQRVAPPHKRNKLEFKFEGGVISLAGAKSVSQLSNKSARYVFRDEAPKWPRQIGDEAGAFELAGQRTKGQYFSTIFDLGTVTVPDDVIMQGYDESDQGYYEVPCPLCGAYQELIWRQVKWPHDDEGKSVKPEEAAENAWYECGECGGEIREADRRWLLDHLHLVRAGEQIESITKPPPADQEKLRLGARRTWSVTLADGTVKHYRLAGEPTIKKTRGFRISRLYSPFCSWGSMVAEWLAIGTDMSRRQVFINSALAEPFRVKTLTPEAETMAKHVWAGAKIGVVPAGYDIITAGADVQQNFVRFSVWAWRLDGARHLIEHGELAGPDELAGLTDGTTWEGDDGVTRSLVMMFIDRRYRKGDVQAFARGRSNVMCCQGVGIARRGPVSESVIKKDGRTGKGLAPGLWVQVASVHVSTFKDEFHGRVLDIEPQFDQPTRPAQAVTFYEGTDVKFFDSLTAEKRVDSTNMYGQTVSEWARIRDDNHDLDTTVYAGAAYFYCRALWAPTAAKRSAPAGRPVGRRPIRTKY